jgi:hypothetical protein
MPWSDTPAWDCAGKPVCAHGSPAVLFGWSRGGAPLALPIGVGISVGPNTGIRQVVLQVRHTFSTPFCVSLRLSCSELRTSGRNSSAGSLASDPI